MENSEIFEILEKLCVPMGVSGCEDMAAMAALELLAPYGEGHTDSRTGNVMFRRAGWKEGRPVLLLDAHIDEVGYIVSYITPDGFLKISPCGGIDARTLLARQVSVYGTAGGETEKLFGVTASIPPHLSRDSSAAPKMSDVYVDMGFSDSREAGEKIRLGDYALIENGPVKLLNDRVSSKALDDRAGCAAIIMALDLLKDRDIGYNIAVTFTVQEEVGTRGAVTAAYTAAPDKAIVVDMSFAPTPDEDEEECSPLESGVMIGFSPFLSRTMSREMAETAQRHGIPFTYEVMAQGTGTNADRISISRGGVPTVTLSIPERFMHTPAEVVSLGDIRAAAELIAAYAEEGAAEE
ncbi:MAG: M20/M25/M40 family metallo-hydrolase [Ruminococcus sp.]|nr:M20/M25/M40 family metallo-hydrolase [Ruminococcus sp.]